MEIIEERNNPVLKSRETEISQVCTRLDQVLKREEKWGGKEAGKIFDNKDNRGRKE